MDNTQFDFPPVYHLQLSKQAHTRPAHKSARDSMLHLETVKPLGEDIQEDKEWVFLHTAKLNGEFPAVKDLKLQADQPYFKDQSL